MANAISNTSPLYYLHQVGAIELLPKLFENVWVPPEVVQELENGRKTGCSVPELGNFDALQIVAPRQIPSRWLSSDLGPGELAALALGIENPSRILLLDDGLARRIGQSAGLQVWGTLKVILEAKSRQIIPAVGPVVTRLKSAGMWISPELTVRILKLAGEQG